MIVKAITDRIESLPKELQKYAFTQDDQGKLDISVGKCYAVYAINEEGGRQLFLVHTDDNNIRGMWWMPAELYQLVDKTYPKGWKTKK